VKYKLTRTEAAKVRAGLAAASLNGEAQGD
jgi:hypothetical protein